MQQATRVAKNTGFLYARMAITVFISLYSTRLILNALGSEDFGIFNVVGGAIAMLTFLNAAMAGATQRFMSYSQGEGNIEKQKSIFNVSVVLHFIIGFLVVALLEGVGYFLFDGLLNIAPDRLTAAKMIYHFMMVSTFFTIISVPYDAVINAHENMLLVAIMGVFEAILKLSVAVYITYSANDKLIYYGLLMACISILLMVIQRIYCHLKYEEVVINPKKYLKKPLLKEMTGFAGWSFLGSSSSMLAFYGQGILINMFFGTAVNAAQGISGQVSGQLGAFANTMMKALNPIIMKSEGAGNRELMLKASLMGSKISFFFLMFFYIPIIIEMPYVFNIWLKEVPEYAIIFCRLLLFRNLIEQLFIPLISSISAVGNIRNYQTYNSVLNFLPLVCSYIMFTIDYPPYSLYIVFIGYSILNATMILIFTKQHCNLSITLFIKQILLRCLISFILIYGLVVFPYYIMEESFFRMLVVTSISIISFFIIVWFLGLNKNERRSLHEIINSLFHNDRSIAKINFLDVRSR